MNEIENFYQALIKVAAYKMSLKGYCENIFIKYKWIHRKIHLFQDIHLLFVSIWCGGVITCYLHVFHIFTKIMNGGDVRWAIDFGGIEFCVMRMFSICSYFKHFYSYCVILLPKTKKYGWLYFKCSLTKVHQRIASLSCTRQIRNFE